MEGRKLTVWGNQDIGRYMRRIHFRRERATLYEQRRKFLAAVADVCPQVLEKLADEPLRSYRACLARANQPDTPRKEHWIDHIGFLRPKDLHLPRDPSLLYLRDCLTAWATGYRINEPWVIDAALQTLGWSLMLGQDVVQFFYAQPERFLGDEWDQKWKLEVFPITINVDVAWEPAQESLAFLRKRIADACAQQLNDQVRNFEATSRGKRLPFKSPKQARGDVHFEWLARYVVENQSASRLAMKLWPELERDSKDHLSKTRNVHDAIRRTANLIGLTLPPSPRR